MRVLILSDIHSNLEALEACLAAAPPHDAVANLGDVVGYGASPNEVVARSAQLGQVVVRGNHDKACVGLSKLDYFNPVAALAVLWTQQQLTAEAAAWLRTLPEGPLTFPELAGVQFVHGSPFDEDEYLILPDDALGPLEESAAPLTFFGHTHVQGGFCLDEPHPRSLRPVFRKSDGVATHELLLQQNVRYLINPGSVGQPRDGDRRTAFALFDSENNSVTYYRVPYDVERAQQRILAARLPEKLAARLANGR